MLAGTGVLFAKSRQKSKMFILRSSVRLYLFSELTSDLNFSHFSMGI